MNLKAKAAHGLKWKLITIIGRQFLTFFIFTTLARLLDPAAFGLIGLVGIYLGFVGMFIDQGIGMAIIQRQELEPEHLDAAFWFNMGIGLFLCVGTMVLAGPISSLFAEPKLVPLLRWTSLSLVIGAASEIQMTLLVREMNFRSMALRSLVGSLIGGVVGMIMAFADYGVWALVGQQLAAALAGVLLLWTSGSYRSFGR